MSVEDFKKFGQLCAEDEAIREKVKQIGIDNVDGWIEYSKNELGLNFDKADMQALAKEVGPTDELTEDQLEQVAGGAVTTTAVVVGALAGAGLAAGFALGAAVVAKRW